MDYEFSTDKYQHPVAQMSMGHEAIGRWLSEELTSLDGIEAVLNRLRAVERGGERTVEWCAGEFQLRATRDEVEVRATVLGLEPFEPLPEDTALFDDELFACCGLPDLIGLLQSWHDFLLL